MVEASEMLVTQDKAAKALDISLSLFKRLRREGQIRVVRIGRRAIRVRVSEIERLCSREE